MDNWNVYLLRCNDNSLYTGIATDVKKRLLEHIEGRGAKYLRGKAPLELVFTSKIGNRRAAQQVESKIKKLPKKEKENFLQDPEGFKSFIFSIIGT